MTRDGELIVFHDSTLERMCGSPSTSPRSISWRFAGSVFPTAGDRILREALEAMNGLPTLIEVKIDPPNR